MTQQKTKYKTPILTEVFVSIMGWMFVFGIFTGIWLAQYRWQLIFTSLFAIVLAIVITLADKAQEDKFNQKQKEEK